MRRHECDFTRDAIEHRNSRGKRSVLAMTIWPHVHAILGIICLLPGIFPGSKQAHPSAGQASPSGPYHARAARPVGKYGAGRRAGERPTKTRVPEAELELGREWGLTFEQSRSLLH